MPLPPRIERLTRLAALPERRVLGLMSGTSLDGLDLALCRFSGQGQDTAWGLEQFHTVPYTEAEQAQLRAAASLESVELRKLTTLHAWLAHVHARMVRETLTRWGIRGGKVHLLASHGQTVYHAPGGWEEGGTLRHATLQLGDGDQLAVATGLPVLSDFRQKEIAFGGQGAPLASYGEWLLFSGPAPRLLLNLGGIANFTCLPPKGESTPLVCGDTGPANTLIDRAVRMVRPEQDAGFDRDGQLAAAGTVRPELLAALLDHPYFSQPCPKSTGPELFGQAFLDAAIERAGVRNLPPQDLIATVTRLTVESVAATLRREIGDLEGCAVYASGGGRHNPTLMEELRTALPEVAWKDIEMLGLPTDAKEAVLFAALAHESLFGEGVPAPGFEKPGRLFGLGKLSWPD